MAAGDAVDVLLLAAEATLTRIAVACGDGHDAVAPAHRLVRARAPRPAHLGDRPLQLPLHVLHAGRRHGLAAPLGDPQLRGDRTGGPGAASSSYGIDSIRLTGGEPTVRAGLPELVRRLAALGVDVALTTNGSRLESMARPLAEAGLRRINISCDSLHDGRFAELTRRDDLRSVLAGIDAAVDAGLDPVKLNVVLRRGVNDDEAVAFADFGRAKGVVVRFIEFMPLDADGGWSSGEVVPGAEIVAAIDAVHPLEPVARAHEPAARWRYLDGQGEIGVIDSVTEPFCARLRPHPPHRRRPPAGLPVRHRRGRPRARRCGAGATTRRSPSSSRARWRPRARATRSARSPSCGRTARCPRSAAEQPARTRADRSPPPTLPACRIEASPTWTRSAGHGWST